MAETDNTLASINAANRKDIYLIAESVICHVISNCGFQMGSQNSSNECDMGSNKTAIINTVQGSVILQFLPRLAPCHVANFEKLAQSGLYNCTIFHRIVKGFVIRDWSNVQLYLRSKNFYIALDLIEVTTLKISVVNNWIHIEDIRLITITFTGVFAGVRSEGAWQAA